MIGLRLDTRTKHPYEQTYSLINRKQKENDESRLISLNEQVKSKDNSIYLLRQQLNLNKQFLEELSLSLEKIGTTKDSLKLTRELKRLQIELDLFDRHNQKFYVQSEEFSSIDSQFIKRVLKLYPSLSKSEIELIGYLRLNLTCKQIATLNNVSVGSVKAMRYRLRKKMSLNQRDDLVRRLNQI